MLVINFHDYEDEYLASVVVPDNEFETKADIAVTTAIMQYLSDIPLQNKSQFLKDLSDFFYTHSSFEYAAIITEERFAENFKDCDFFHLQYGKNYCVADFLNTTRRKDLKNLFDYNRIPANIPEIPKTFLQRYSWEKAPLILQHYLDSNVSKNNCVWVSRENFNFYYYSYV